MKTVTIKGKKGGSSEGSITAFGTRFKFGREVEVSDAVAKKVEDSLGADYNLTIKGDDPPKSKSGD